MTADVIWDGNHSLHNLTEEEKRNLPPSIHGICACGAGFTLYPKIGVFDQNTAWYVCNACGYQISLSWQHEEERFKAVRSILEAVLLGNAQEAHWKGKALRLLSHAQRTGIMRDPYFSREENEQTIQKYMGVVYDAIFLHGELLTYLELHTDEDYTDVIKRIEQLEEVLPEIKSAVQELHQIGKSDEG